MKALSELLQASQTRVLSPRGEFPSYAHEVAWMLAEDFQEPYGMWVRNVLYAGLNPGQIKYEYEYLKSRRLTKRQRIKILLSKMKVHIHPTRLKKSAIISDNPNTMANKLNERDQARFDELSKNTNRTPEEQTEFDRLREQSTRDQSNRA